MDVMSLFSSLDASVFFFTFSIIEPLLLFILEMIFLFSIIWEKQLTGTLKLVY